MRRYGLIGYPLTHSFSAAYFAEKFRREELPDCRYDNFPLMSVGELPALVGRIPELSGLNVTIPHKETVIPYLHSMDDTAEGVGAVNTIRIINGRLVGYNTDVHGFTASLSPLVQELPAGPKALVLGSGGAARAVMYALEKMGIPYRLVSRNARGDAITYASIDRELMAAHSVIINTTPLGMYPDVRSCPPIPYDSVGAGHLLYDLVYNPEETFFLRQGRERGAWTKNGYEMLCLQAEMSWKIWNDS